MKKMIVVALIVIASIAGVMFMRNRFDMGMFSQAGKQGVDLVVVNDSNDDISIEYMENGKEVAQVLNSGEQATGGNGFIRVFTAKKDGSYELTYTYPRPAGAPEKVTLSQIVEAAQRENIGDELYTKEGMIGDIKVEYEEVRQMD
jgi:hypothetical protein